MNKKKTIILISAIAVVLVAIIIGVIILSTSSNNIVIDTNKTDRLISFYNNLSARNEYNFNMTIDENNKIYYSRKGNMAYMNTFYNEQESEYIIKNGNTYLIRDEEKIYYTYRNNETELTKVTGALDAIKDYEYTSGKEKIDNKEYYYEEYQGVTMLSIGISDNSDIQNNKTRFYFEGDELVYIKTITKDNQELMKIETSYNVKDNLFEIPSDYQEG